MVLGLRDESECAEGNMQVRSLGSEHDVCHALEPECAAADGGAVEDKAKDLAGLIMERISSWPATV